MAKANPVQKTSKAFPISYLLAAKAMAPAYWFRMKLGAEPEKFGSRISSFYEKYGDAISRQKPLLAERAYTRAKRLSPKLAVHFDQKIKGAARIKNEILTLSYEKGAEFHIGEARRYEGLFDSFFRQDMGGYQSEFDELIMKGSRINARRNQAYNLSCAAECFYLAAKAQFDLKNIDRASKLNSEAKKLSDQALFILKVNLDFKPSEPFYQATSSFGLGELFYVADVELVQSRINDFGKLLQ